MIKWIIIFIILILVLSYFGVNIQSVVNSPTGQSNVSYVWSGVTYVWNNYLSVPFNYLWRTVGTTLWNAFTQGIQNIKVNQNMPNLNQISPKAVTQ